jgi:hypothetical protein
VDLVSACGTTTIDGLGFPTTFGLGDNDAKAITAPRTGSGEVYSHAFNLTLPVGALNTGASSCAPFTKCFCYPSTQSLHNSRPCCLASSLLLKIGPSSFFDLRNHLLQMIISSSTAA